MQKKSNAREGTTYEREQAKTEERRKREWKKKKEMEKKTRDSNQRIVKWSERNV